MAQVLLAVHRSYAATLKPILDRVHALAHITGGGIPGNLARVLPSGTEAVVNAGSWPWPSLFRVLMRAGQVSREEMRRVFNLGIGMIAVLARDDVEAALQAAERAKVQAWLIGEIRAASRPPPPHRQPRSALKRDNAREALAMHRALELAWRGWGRVSPNPLVGAVAAGRQPRR